MAGGSCLPARGGSQVDSLSLCRTLDSELRAQDAQLFPEGPFTATILSYGACSLEGQTLDGQKGIQWGCRTNSLGSQFTSSSPLGDRAGPRSETDLGSLPT